MKKHIAKNLRELAEHLPPVFEWIPNTETKTGAELNAIIIEQHAKQQASLSWHAKIINVARQHLADLGLKHLAPKTPELKDVNAQYKLKKKTIRLVNHYHKLKEAWERGGQDGITQYSKWAVMANQEQQKQANETNTTK